ncbi:MAG: GAF domain-containing protein [Candidatus Sabulitectum sp.]|nr:GAF domain-containing protein [Candidatus Sabulitectum sp.]
MTVDVVKKLIADILINNESAGRALQTVCDLLREEMDDYHWVGYYLVDPALPSELILGPFAGAPTAYTRIGFGKGICGQAARSLSVLVVDDVNLESNYLSCSSDVRSEFVAPILWKGKLVGELDLDSNRIAAFGKEDIELLNRVAEVTAEAVAFCSAGAQLE